MIEDPGKRTLHSAQAYLELGIRLYEIGENGQSYDAIERARDLLGTLLDESRTPETLICPVTIQE